MTLDRFTDHAETARNASPTAHLLEELALYAHRPYDDETDPRPLPEPAKLQGALADMFDAMVATLSDTRLEPDLHALLWSVVNVFHRRIDRIERDLDANEAAQRMGQKEQDGSEVKSVELERLVAQGLTLIERRNSFEFIRDTAAELYGIHTGQAWRPRTGSMVNRATMTAAMIDSREFINARRRADAQVLLPKGTRIAFAGGVDCNDHQRIPTSGVVMWSPVRKASEYTRFLASMPSLGHLIVETVSSLASSQQAASLSERHESKPSDAASREVPCTCPQ
jgi:hypothetical protein